MTEPKMFGGSLKSIAIQGYNEEKMEITTKLTNGGNVCGIDALYKRIAEIDERIQGLIDMDNNK